MSPIKKFSGSVSAIALSVALGSVASANVPPSDLNSKLISQTAISSGMTLPGDLLVDVMLRSGGHLTAQSLEKVLPLVLKPLSAERAAALPELMTNLRGAGVGPDVQAAALKTLTALIADASGKTLDRELTTRLIAEVKANFAQKIQYAKVQNNPGTGKASDRGKERNNNNGRGNGTYGG